jgi:hypothetical protein
MGVTARRDGRSEDKFQGIDLLYMTAAGAKAGQQRQSTVAQPVPASIQRP